MSDLFNRYALWNKGKKYIQMGILSISILVVWEVSIPLLNINPIILPPFSEVIRTLLMESQVFVDAMFATLKALLAGFVIGSVVGFTLAVIIFYIPLLRYSLYPILTTLYLIPRIAVAPLVIIWFGAGISSKIVIAFLMVFFPVLVNSFTGFMDYDDDLIKMSELYKVPEWFLFWKVRFPHASPYIVDSLKISMVFSIIGVVVAEFLTSPTGIGTVIIDASHFGQTARIFAAIVILAITSLVLYGIVLLFEERYMGWYGENDTTPN